MNEKILTALNQIAGMETRTGYSGICVYVYDIINPAKSEDEELIDELLFESFKTWPKFSGNENFPVPGVNGLSARDAYWGGAGNLWQGEYGNLRLELLDHCINYFEEKVKNEAQNS